MSYRRDMADLRFLVLLTVAILVSLAALSKGCPMPSLHMLTPVHTMTDYQQPNHGIGIPQEGLGSDGK
jgi:hypothetical protein